MGLDAAVYRNVEALKARFGAEAFDVEPETGEAMPKSGIHLKEPRSTFIAVELRLGNIDGISKLRSALSAVLDEKSSLLLQKVLYSGSHGGDTIKMTEFSKMKEEIDTIRKSTSDSAAMAFAAQMEELINVALAENNPIVFV